MHKNSSWREINSMSKRHPQTIRSVSVNAGVVAWYRKRLIKELKAMHKSVAYWIEAEYRAQEPEIVGDAFPHKNAILGENLAHKNAITCDASPVISLLDRFKELSRRWLRRWDIFANWISKRAIEKTQKTTTISMREAFKAAGFSVKFHPDRELNETSRGLIATNVNLITNKMVKPYLADVENIVLQGVSMGRNLRYIREEFTKRYKISERQANFLARDQLDKATQAIQRTNDAQVGITEGIWVHMPGQYTSRATHKGKDMNGVRFKLDEGLYDPDPKVQRNVLPGELYGCRCSYRRVLPDLELINGKEQ